MLVGDSFGYFSSKLINKSQIADLAISKTISLSLTISFTPHEDGDYQICFDNGISSYYGKTIFFAFDEQGDDGNDEDDGEDEEDDDDNYWKRLVSDDFKQINEYDGKVNDFKVRLEVTSEW